MAVSKLDPGQTQRHEHDDTTFAKRVEQVAEWGTSNVPAANTAATISKSGVTGQRHICRSITAAAISGATAPTAGTVTVVLRDGATGVGAILWQTTLGITATAGNSDRVAISGLSIAGTAGNAMTLEFTTAGGANTFETVSMTGYDTV